MKLHDFFRNRVGIRGPGIRSHCRKLSEIQFDKKILNYHLILGRNILHTLSMHNFNLW